jgi:hypothetical protein
MERGTIEFTSNLYEYFIDVLRLFGVDYKNLDLDVCYSKNAGYEEIEIGGPRPYRFDEVVMDEWRRIGDTGWRMVMGSKVTYSWESCIPGGLKHTIPGLYTVITAE